MFKLMIVGRRPGTKTTYYVVPEGKDLDAAVFKSYKKTEAMEKQRELNSPAKQEAA